MALILIKLRRWQWASLNSLTAITLYVIRGLDFVWPSFLGETPRPRMLASLMHSYDLLPGGPTPLTVARFARAIG
jgi:hypothetical protein